MPTIEKFLHVLRWILGVATMIALTILGHYFFKDLVKLESIAMRFSAIILLVAFVWVMCEIAVRFSNCLGGYLGEKFEAIQHTGSNIDWNRVWTHIRLGIFNGSVFGFLSVIFGLLSVVFNWIYFSSLGIPLTKAPISIGDYVTTSIIWFPIVSILTVSHLAIATLLFWISKKIKISPKIILCVGLVLALLMPFAYLVYRFSFGDVMEFLMEPFTALAVFISAFIMIAVLAFLSDPISKVRENFKEENNYAFFFLPIIPFLCFALVFFVVGLTPIYARISADCSKVKERYIFTLANGDEVNGILARNFETYFLIRNCEYDENGNLKNGNLEFLKADRLTGPNWKKQAQPMSSTRKPKPITPTPPIASWLLQLSAEQH